MFYCPDIELVGWGSTTFKSAAEGKFIALFGFDKASGSSYADTQAYPYHPATYYTTQTIGGQNYVIIENENDSVVRYFDVEAGEFISALPTA